MLLSSCGFVCARSITATVLAIIAGNFYFCCMAKYPRFRKNFLQGNKLKGFTFAL